MTFWEREEGTESRTKLCTYGINCYEFPDEKTRTLELRKGLVFAHKCLMTEHMDNECCCAASCSNWNLGRKGEKKITVKIELPPKERYVGEQSLALRVRVLPCSLP